MEKYKFQTIKIHGKDYVPVSERVKYFRKAFPTYSIECEIISITDDMVIMKAYIKDDNERIIANGYAQEKIADGHINKNNHLENAETSAVGRALGFMGIGIDAAIASAEEVMNASKYDNSIIRKAAETVKKQNKTENWLEIHAKGIFKAIKNIPELDYELTKQQKSKLLCKLGTDEEKGTHPKTWKELNSFQVQAWKDRLYKKDKKMIERVKEALLQLMEEEDNKSDEVIQDAVEEMI